MSPIPKTWLPGKSIIHHLPEFAYDVAHRLCPPAQQGGGGVGGGTPFKVAFVTQANKRRRLAAEYTGMKL